MSTKLEERVLCTVWYCSDLITRISRIPFAVQTPERLGRHDLLVCGKVTFQLKGRAALFRETVLELQLDVTLAEPLTSRRDPASQDKTYDAFTNVVLDVMVGSRFLGVGALMSSSTLSWLNP